MNISEGQTYITAAGERVKVVGRQKTNRGALWVYYGYRVTIDGVRIGPVGEMLGWKSDGKDWSGVIGNTIVRESDVGMKLGVAQSVILERLIEACETDRAMPGRVGPRKYGSFMLETFMTADEIETVESWCVNQSQQYQTTARWEAANRVHVTHAMRSPQRISRMDESFDWLGRFVFDHEMRKVIVSYATVKASGTDWSDFIQQRNKKHRSSKAWVKRTLYRWIERGLQLIADGTRKNGIILRDGSGLQVAHERAETPCKSICSTDLRAAG